ncbi:hypothetical protein HD553DRAFT_317856 [Filobasidium floriforme]|uniref:uncharacterized protein n=1 Tax=Filobasidium floriforme TaxID=5210 RepID=UPI001E8EBF59|nr:uncharacterized protein HD553DRAFT_317856 [Filobasidium floriforme]KAH8079884.1 hypothetical protein HD553DRAFT_317856 [Filobasidium floriforme]
MDTGKQASCGASTWEPIQRGSSDVVIHLEILFLMSATFFLGRYGIRVIIADRAVKVLSDEIASDLDLDIHGGGIVRCVEEVADPQMRSGKIVSYASPSRGSLDRPISFVGDLKGLRYARGTSYSPSKPFDVGGFGQEVHVDRTGDLFRGLVKHPQSAAMTSESASRHQDVKVLPIIAVDMIGHTDSRYIVVFRPHYDMSHTLEAQSW